MTYELAKQLKDAGFPQQGEGKWWDKNANEFQSLSGDTAHVFYAPTLSELIEACGDDFGALRSAAGLWIADASLKHQPLSPLGSTPEEAVAKLWLALHQIA